MICIFLEKYVVYIIKKPRGNFSVGPGWVKINIIFFAAQYPSADNSANDGYAVRPHPTLKAATKGINLSNLKLSKIYRRAKSPEKNKKGRSRPNHDRPRWFWRRRFGYPSGRHKKKRQDSHHFILSKKGQKYSFCRWRCAKRRNLSLNKEALSVRRISASGPLREGIYQCFIKNRVWRLCPPAMNVDIETNPPLGKIINSNSYSLRRQVNGVGGIPIMLEFPKIKKLIFRKNLNRSGCRFDYFLLRRFRRRLWFC